MTRDRALDNAIQFLTNEDNKINLSIDAPPRVLIRETISKLKEIKEDRVIPPHMMAD